MVTWDAVCSQVLGRQLHIWSLFACTVFVSRVEVTLDSYSNSYLTSDVILTTIIFLFHSISLILIILINIHILLIPSLQSRANLSHHHHCHRPLLLLFFNPYSKSTFSINLSYHILHLCIGVSSRTPDFSTFFVPRYSL